MKPTVTRFAFTFLMCAALGTHLLFGSGLSVQGTVASPYGPVRYALVTFISERDSLARASALTDSLGHYSIDLPTAVEPTSGPPKSFVLAQNYPNPFITITTIPFALPEQSRATVQVYTVLGQLVKEISLGTIPAGTHQLTWDGTDQRGRRLVPGVYLYRLRAGGRSLARKLILGNSTVFDHPAASPLLRSRQAETKPVAELSPADQLYTVLVSAADSTSPPIQATRLSGVSIPGSTTLNLPVTELDDFVLCYARPYNGHGQIFMNDLKGTHPRDISGYDGTDDYPACSPDGTHVVYQRSTAWGAPLTMAFKFDSQTYVNLTADGGISATLPQWTPDGRTFFAYSRSGFPRTATFLMNPDGSSKTKILDTAASSVYFYINSYDLIYVAETQVFKTNTAGSTQAFVCDLRSVFGVQVADQGFNPLTEELLILYKSTIDSLWKLAAYNVSTHATRDLFVEDAGFEFVQATFSPDCSQIAVVEQSPAEQYLSIIAHGTKSRLLNLATSSTHTYFSFEPARFSPDGMYLAFSEINYGHGPYISLDPSVYVLNLATGKANFVDDGHYPTWIRHP